MPPSSLLAADGTQHSREAAAAGRGRLPLFQVLLQGGGGGAEVPPAVPNLRSSHSACEPSPAAPRVSGRELLMVGFHDAKSPVSTTVRNTSSTGRLITCVSFRIATPPPPRPRQGGNHGPGRGAAECPSRRKAGTRFGWCWLHGYGRTLPARKANRLEQRGAHGEQAHRGRRRLSRPCRAGGVLGRCARLPRGARRGRAGRDRGLGAGTA